MSPRTAEVPEQEEPIAPPERAAFYPDIPRIPGEFLLGEVIDILGYRGPFDSKPQFQKPDAAKKKQYVVLRARVHGPIDLGKGAEAELKATAAGLSCGSLITTSVSANRILSKLARVGRRIPESPDDPPEVLNSPIRGQFVKVKTEAGFEVRDLIAADSAWSCPTCKGTAK